MGWRMAGYRFVFLSCNMSSCNTYQKMIVTYPLHFYQHYTPQTTYPPYHPYLTYLTYLTYPYFSPYLYPSTWKQPPPYPPLLPYPIFHSLALVAYYQYINYCYGYIMFLICCHMLIFYDLSTMIYYGYEHLCLGSCCSCCDVFGTMVSVFVIIYIVVMDIAVDS